MKKFGKVLLIILAVVMAASIPDLVLGSKPYWTDVRAGAEPWGDDPDLTQTELGTRFEIRDFDRTSCVVFDENRQVVEADGITPIDFDRRNFWGVWDYDAFVEMYGKPHFYIGNTQEAWVTDDGYIITRWTIRSWLSFPLQFIGLAGEIDVYDLLATPE